MKLVKATHKNLDAIMSIIADAQNYLASLNIDQWQNGYPDTTRIITDINKNENFIVLNNEDVVIATTMFTTYQEPTYKTIEGNWLTSENAIYGVIHRMAVRNEFRRLGISKFIFSHFENELINNNITSMRIDTHEDNLGMQTLLKSLNYTYCGVIYLANNDKRLAFEKLLK